MAVDPRLALMGADPAGPVNAFMGARDNARAGVFQEQQQLATAQEASAKARSAKLGQLANFAFRVAREPIATRGPLLEQAKAAAAQLYGNDPQVMQIIASVTPDNIEGYASALVGIKEQLDAGKTDADIANVYNTMDNRTANTQSMIGDRATRTNIYGGIAQSQIANNYDTIRSRQGKDAATGFGQVPEGQLLDPATGRASDIPGAYRKPAAAGAGVTVDPATGALVVNSPKLNEGERKGIYFLNRATSTADQLDKIDEALTGSWDSAMGGIPGGNYLRSDAYQKADQLGDEWIASVLRQESGAAIPDAEMERYRQTYLPRPGDGPEVIAQKREARRRVIESMKLGLGNLANMVPTGDGIVAHDATSDPYSDVDAIVGLGP